MNYIHSEVSNIIDPYLEYLKGKTIVNDVTPVITASGEFLVLSNGFTFEFYHPQKYNEEVLIESFKKSSNSLAGSVITLVECYSMKEDIDPDLCEGFTLLQTTNYIIHTTKGTLWIRWAGKSNGEPCDIRHRISPTDRDKFQDKAEQFLKEYAKVVVDYDKKLEILGVAESIWDNLI